ncbi:unnamed protein product [Adineta ricciae]|uniref:Isochorismatase-like domain-containing protein n=1 Tax=Adineta ricciae TaxID=249248 RepID=A0A815BHE6_ADIRI|nr:unnamed protein product [Adineta ricciae]CAF1314597.1 unnamed protein product [Adineta ricciae]
MSSDNENESVLIGNDSDFWRYSGKNGFDLTRGSDHSLRLQTTTQPITIDPTRTALIIIDMQNFFIHPSVRSHPAGLVACEQLLRFAIPAARKSGIQVIWLNWGLTDDDIHQAPPSLKRAFSRGLTTESSSGTKSIYTGLGSELGEIVLPSGEHINGGRLLMRDTWNASLYDPLFESYQNSQSHTKADQWFHKDRVSGLWSHDSPLLSYLRSNRIVTLIFAGVNTDQCVAGTLHDAEYKGFDCILLSDGCGTMSPSFARECVEYNCSRGDGFLIDSETLAKNIEDYLN